MDAAEPGAVGAQEPHPPARGAARWAWLVVAAAGGVACFVLPPYIGPGGRPEPPYGHPLLPWLATAFANVRFGASLAGFLGLGVVLGLAQPRRRWSMVVAAASALCLLHAINVVGDGIVDPTDHNLLPFEFVFLAAIVAPVVPGVFLGAFLRRG